jgi:hypothetical protein
MEQTSSGIMAVAGSAVRRVRRFQPETGAAPVNQATVAVVDAVAWLGAPIMRDQLLEAVARTC